MPRNTTYYDGDLRRDLLDAALAAVADVGPAGVSLRGLARSLGVSHAAPANHFPDKESLFTAIAIEGFDRLRQTFVKGLEDVGEDAGWLDRLRAHGNAYLHFAFHNEAHFIVMWRRDLLNESDPALREGAAETLGFLLAGVADAQQNGWLADRDPTTVAVMLWSVVHGLATLWLQGPLRHDLNDANRQLAASIIDLVTGMT